MRVPEAPARRRRSVLAPSLGLLGAFVVMLLGGCASGGGTYVAPWLDRGDDPWRIPDTSYPTQRLYRVKYDGPQGKLGFKLTLYLEGEEEFRMQGADALGRKAWDLEVDADDRALWIDHRNREYCEASAASRLAIVPLARLPLVALPKLLLGRLPSRPAADLRRTATAVYYRDARGHLWNGGFVDDHLAWWTLVDGTETVSTWRLEEKESVFVDLEGEQRLRWREVVREPLKSVPLPLEVPSGYEVGGCG